jgi:16S rRNA G966 N2-methylase RsmD
MMGGHPAGFVGYSRAGNWHDYPTFRALVFAESADDVLAHAKAYRLTHIVYRDPPYETENAAMRAFRERYAVTVWRGNGIVVAEIPAAAK